MNTGYKKTSTTQSNFPDEDAVSVELAVLDGTV